MADFQVMGGVPDFYSQILNSARQQLVLQPDGTYAPAPQFGGSTCQPRLTRRAALAPLIGVAEFQSGAGMPRGYKSMWLAR